MVEYFIDGSAKGNMVGAGVVRINEFGFIEKRHFTIEHANPSSQTAEGYAFEKALEMISESDIHNNGLIDVYTDCRQLITCLAYNSRVEFQRSDFFIRQETGAYFQHLRETYKELIMKKSKSCIYHCTKTGEARPLIKVFFKEDAVDRQYLQEAHALSRKYIKNEESKALKVELKAVPKIVPKLKKIELKAVKKENEWHIIKNKKSIAVNKRPLIALSEALVQPEVQNKEIKLCVYLENLLKSTNKNNLSQNSLISAMKIIDKHKKMFVS